MSKSIPTSADVDAAARRIAGMVERTPLRRLRLHGRDLWVKCECLQTGGAFKLRGATNRLLLLDEQQRRAGVVAFSSGNHAQGVAIAARRLGIEATIVMPDDAPTLKVDGTRAEGATIVFYDRKSESREAIAADIASRKGAVVVPSFDDPLIVAGQGTAGLEVAAQLSEAGEEEAKAFVVPTGGGGLAAGIALACPSARIHCVEPQGWDDMARSFDAGTIVPVGSDAPPTLCDALQTPQVSPITFSILRDRGASGTAVSEEEVKEAVRFAWTEMQLVVEPGGAVALAAVLSRRVEIGESTVVLLSGGNIDPDLHRRIVGSRG